MENKNSENKVPEITLLFWIVKILATTLGETGGDAVSMSMGLGYLKSTLIFGVIFILALSIQMAAKKFHPWTYWFTIIATTTVGTTLADFADRSLGLGYTGGASLLVALLISSFAAWYFVLGTISIRDINSSKSELFYWVTIMFSQTLGTALGDWAADSAGLGYLGGIFIFGSLLLFIVAAYFFTKISRTALFWLAFVLTRPLGALVGDFLDKPLSSGGLDLSRYTASIVLVVFIGACLALFPQKPASKMH